MAEWLGSALQKLLQRFESAPDLQQKARLSPGFFVMNVFLLFNCKSDQIQTE